jgi:hypothetical protein
MLSSGVIEIYYPVKGNGLRAKGKGERLKDTGYWIQDTGYRMQETRIISRNQKPARPLFNTVKRPSRWNSDPPKAEMKSIPEFHNL